MKKLVVLLFIGIAMTSVAQNKYVDGTAEEEERKAEQNKHLAGHFIIDGYAGIMSPAWLQNNMFVNVQTDSLNPSTYKSTGIPVVIGLKAEYMLTNRIGLGLDMNYQENGIETTSLQNFVDGSGNVVQQKVITNWNEQKLRVMIRFQAHFGNPEKIDWYGGGAIGFGFLLNRNDASYLQNKPNASDYPFIVVPFRALDFTMKDIGLPLAVRGYIGARFMVTDYFGIYSEIGLLSGSLLNVGASFRL